MERYQIANIKFREVEKGVIVFNLDTGTFHLISKEGFKLLDYIQKKGKVSKKDIEKYCTEKIKVSKEEIETFLKELLKRKILLLSNDKEP